MSHIHKLEAYELDEFIIPFFIFIIFVIFDMIQIQRSRHIEQEKIKIYKAMLNSAHHVLNNFLNQMQIFKMEAENTPDFNPDILKLYDKIMKGASIQIEALSSVDAINESSIIESISPKKIRPDI